jgi:hypothetical protein
MIGRQYKRLYLSLGRPTSFLHSFPLIRVLSVSSGHGDDCEPLVETIWTKHSQTVSTLHSTRSMIIDHQQQQQFRQLSLINHCIDKFIYYYLKKNNQKIVVCFL